MSQHSPWCDALLRDEPANKRICNCSSSKRNVGEIADSILERMDEYITPKPCSCHTRSHPIDLDVSADREYLKNMLIQAQLTAQDFQYKYDELRQQLSFWQARQKELTTLQSYIEQRFNYTLASTLNAEIVDAQKQISKILEEMRK